MRCCVEQTHTYTRTLNLLRSVPKPRVQNPSKTTKGALLRKYSKNSYSVTSCIYYSTNIKAPYTTNQYKNAKYLALFDVITILNRVLYKLMTSTNNYTLFAHFLSTEHIQFAFFTTHAVVFINIPVYMYAVGLR